MKRTANFILCSAAVVASALAAAVIAAGTLAPAAFAAGSAVKKWVFNRGRGVNRFVGTSLLVGGMALTGLTGSVALGQGDGVSAGSNGEETAPGGRGSKIAFTRLKEGPEGNEMFDAEIWVMNGDGSNQRRLTHNTTFDIGAVWSPNGRQIAFSGQQLEAPGQPPVQPRIFLIDADGSDQTALTDPKVPAMFPSWSPDGEKIAYHGLAPGGVGATEVLVIDADGGEPVNLTNNLATDARAAFSPDGEKIAFQSNRDGDVEIYVMNADGSDPVQLTKNNKTADQAPAWSPNGEKIAFQTNRNENIEIYVMNADGTGQTRLTNYAGRDLDPSWSPSGRRITFDRDIDPIQAQIRQQFVMNADGSDPTALTGLPSENGHGDWGRGPALVP